MLEETTLLLPSLQDTRAHSAELLKKTNQGRNTSKGKGKNAKKKERAEDEEMGEHSMMMLTPTVTNCGTVIDCALQAQRVKQIGKNHELQQPWIMDS